MRSLLVIPLAVAAVAVGCHYALAQLGWGGHGREVLFAALACGVSAELALTPAVVRRGADVLALFQTGLLGTVLHLLLTIVMGAIAVAAHLAVDRRAFLYLILVFYWVSLIVMVLILSRLFRQAAARVKAAGPAVG